MGADYAFLLKAEDQNRFVSEVCGEDMIPCPFSGPDSAYRIRTDLGFDCALHDAFINIFNNGWIEVSCTMRYRSQAPEVIEQTKTLCNILASHGPVYVGSDSSVDWDELCDDRTLSSYMSFGTVWPYDPEAETP